ncbi:hypothetical protein FBY35_2651 [Streptomyces sp. SLBN-118]|uniref:hypothetical protein n=1 Tax=Streptomyces sp. SLBN-118 TaxID=2768454 RepID=UPI00114D8CAD|nr:hypothetical protein [Streptomyces sp. SLBN-118]TQK52223.1 hypothetical protein FBY35_2651 [Streptomyces sp. SLBN-118]
MSSRERKEAEVRRMLETPHPPVPTDLAARAAEHGARLLRRHQALRRAVWLMLVAAVIAFAVWAMVAQPWVVAPSDTTPPLEGW